MIKLLSSFNVRQVFHINHPYEICQIVREKIHSMHMCDIKMYAQFPLLRGINDYSDVLIELLMMMDNLYIRPITQLNSRRTLFIAVLFRYILPSCRLRHVTLVSQGLSNLCDSLLTYAISRCSVYTGGHVASICMQKCCKGICSMTDWMKNYKKYLFPQ